MRGNFEQLKKDLIGQNKESLIDYIIDDHYNSFCRQWCDKDAEKLIPYMGWFWRDVSFSKLIISIGKCDSFVGFMENNKWDYPERILTEEEALKFIELLDIAINSNISGLVEEINRNKEEKIKAVYNYMQTLEISERKNYDFI